MQAPGSVTLATLDLQLRNACISAGMPDLSRDQREHLATTIHREIDTLNDAAVSRLRLSIPIPPERYREEMIAFQDWMEFARAHATNPTIVRAQVITQLYVAFVWLRDSLMAPIAKALPGSAFSTVNEFLGSGTPRKLRNAIAHGRWCYLPDFSGIECWAEPARGQPHLPFRVTQVDLDSWQILSRGVAIAALLALTDTVSDTA